MHCALSATKYWGRPDTRPCRPTACARRLPSHRLQVTPGAVSRSPHASESSLVMSVHQLPSCTNDPAPFLLGVNYWPREKAMRMWKAFDIDEVHEDFALIAELGLDVVRIFLLWEDFQPDPRELRCSSLAHLLELADAAAAEGLRLDLTFFTGHMSGPNWAPEWLLDPTAAPHGGRPVVSRGRRQPGGIRNPYTDPLARKAALRMVRGIARSVGCHPAVWAYNLGNEPDLFALPPSAELARDWMRELSDAIHNVDPKHPVTCGLHTDSLTQDNGLRVDQIFAPLDFAAMHAYPMYQSWARGPLDPDVVPFACALTTALSGKPCLAEEWGGCTMPLGQPAGQRVVTATGQTQFMASEEDMATYVQAVLPKLVEVGATGAFLWNFADYSPSIWGQPPCDEYEHERSFGLMRADGSLKPHAEVLRRFADTNPSVAPASQRVMLKGTADDYYRDPSAHLRELYAEFTNTDPRERRTWDIPRVLRPLPGNR